MDAFDSMSRQQLETYVQMKRREINALRSDMHRAQEALSKKLEDARLERSLVVMTDKQMDALRQKLALDGVSSKSKVSDM